MDLSKTITPLLRRVIVFLGLFVGISSLIGPRIISGDILFRDGFAIYGGAGKAAIFALVAFVLLARHSNHPLAMRPWRPALLGWIAAGIMAFGIAWTNIDSLLADQRSTMHLVLAHGGLLLSLLCVAIGSIGPKNIKTIYATYKRELQSAIGIGVAFYGFLLMVYELWQPLASVVLSGVKSLLNLTGLETTVIAPHTLMLDKFSVTVAEPCSGIESIALFTGLYVLMGLLEWRQLHKKRYFIVFPIALLVLCLLNIVRVYLLIIAGYYIDIQIAFSLFHTYAGLIFFVLYSLVFWRIAYSYLIVRRQHHTKPEESA